MHNLLAALVVAAATSYKPSVSLTAPVNPQLAQRRDAIAAKLSPPARQKVHAIALSVASAPAITDGTAQSMINSAFGNLDGADIEALAFLVLMDASQSMQDDVKTILNEVNEMNKQKETLRQDLSRENQLKPGVSKVRVQTLATTFTMPPPLPANATVAQKQQRLDLLTDLDNSMQLRIQMLTSNAQSAQQMASNIVKKLNDSQNSMLGKLK